MPTTTDFSALAAELDARDPLAAYRSEFAPIGPDVVAYLDGNSLGRPPARLPAALSDFVTRPWGDRLIRGWTDDEPGTTPWMDWPTALGDRLGTACLGAAPGQTVIADSTSVLLYKLARAALSVRAPDRDEIVVDADNFPTDRYLLEGIAAELDLRLRWVPTDPAAGLTPELVAAAVGPRTALLVASHVAYRSGYLADLAVVTELVHAAGGLVLWDCSHSVGSVPIELDPAGADFAVGCSYKYLNAGPGAPAFGYVAARHQAALRQPIQGWMGHAEPFAMGPGYRPAAGIRGYLTGTPPILAMVPLGVALEVVERAGIDAVRAKSLVLTDLAISLADTWLAPYGVGLASPRDPARRGGHVTLRRADFAEVNDELWRRGVVGDFRAPDGIRLGLSPLTTSFAELVVGVRVLAEVLVERSGPPL
ncbi:MAG: kynureninase [Propionibacteriaceae bacterium]